MDNNQHQVHSFLRCGSLSRFGAAPQSAITPYRMVPSRSIA